MLIFIFCTREYGFIIMFIFCLSFSSERARTLSIIDSSKSFRANPSFLYLKGVRNQGPFPVHVSAERS